MDITNFCNGECIYCFTNSIKNDNFLSNNELKEDEVCNLIDEMHNLGIKSISIAGGEPFLKDIVKIGNYNADKVNLSITSNGTILDNRIIEFLKNNKVKLTISLDTLDETISSKVRKNIDLRKVINNIKTMCSIPEILPNISVRSVVSVHNYDKVFEIIDFSMKIIYLL